MSGRILAAQKLIVQNMIRFGRVAMGMFGGLGAEPMGSFGGLGAEPPALENFVFFEKIINFGPILMKINAFEMCWHKN